MRPKLCFDDYLSKRETKYRNLKIDSIGKRKALKQSFENQEELNDQDIWSMSKVERGDFYAAAYFFDTIDSQRSWVEQELSEIPRPEDHPESKTALGQLLDQIALLFARAKRLKNRDRDQNICPSSAGENVTAAAMETSTYLMGNEDYVTIHITKNAGPQDFGDISDQSFATILQSWFNTFNLNTEPPSSKDDKTWQSMQSFWFYRHRYYVDEIKISYQRWIDVDGIDIAHHEPPIHLITIIEQLNQDTVLFRFDWAHVGKLVTWLSEAGNSVLDDKAILTDYVDRVCFEDDEEWNLKYRKPVSLEDKRWKQLNDFRKIIHHFKMLRTLRVVRNAFREFGACYPGIKIAFQLRPVPKVVPIPKHILQSVIREYKQYKGSEMFKQNLKNTLTRLGWDTIHRNFHCELQLLEIQEADTQPPHIHEDDWPIQRYIGCSKLSCFLCWEILQASGFSTKNTHGKLHYGCAFPFESAPESCRKLSAKTLSTLNIRLQNSVQKQACDLDEEIERYSAGSDTLSASSELACLWPWGSRTRRNCFILQEYLPRRRTPSEIRRDDEDDRLNEACLAWEEERLWNNMEELTTYDGWIDDGSEGARKLWEM